MFRGVDHIHLVVNDVEEYESFFKTMGFEVINRSEHGGRAVELQLPGENQPVFEITAVTGGSGGENPGLSHIAFRVDDVQKTYDELKSRDFKFRNEPHLVEVTGRTLADFRDPDGWRFQLVDSSRKAVKAT